MASIRLERQQNKADVKMSIGGTSNEKASEQYHRCKNVQILIKKRQKRKNMTKKKQNHLKTWKNVIGISSTAPG